MMQRAVKGIAVAFACVAVLCILLMACVSSDSGATGNMSKEFGADAAVEQYDWHRGSFKTISAFVCRYVGSKTNWMDVTSEWEVLEALEAISPAATVYLRYSPIHGEVQLPYLADPVILVCMQSVCGYDAIDYCLAKSVFPNTEKHRRAIRETGAYVFLKGQGASVSPLTFDEALRRASRYVYKSGQLEEVRYDCYKAYRDISAWWLYYRWRMDGIRGTEMGQYLVIDDAGKIVYVNPYLLEAIGFARDAETAVILEDVRLFNAQQ